MSSLHKIISAIEARPGMYLGDCTLTRLMPFLNGYMTGLCEDKIQEKDVLAEYKEFNEWVREKYGVVDSHGCESIIRYWSGDEQDALSNFFKHWNEFLLSKTR